MPSYSPLEKILISRPVDRISFIRKICTGKTILDLGAMDETAFLLKRGQGTWLHEELTKVAKQVVGLDNSSSIPQNGLVTANNAAIHRGDIMKLDAWLNCNALNPDVVVAGELIEHLENPLLFLQSIKSNPALAGKTLVLSTPNATAIHNCLIGLFSRESTHHDHLCILSYKTICTLLARAGFSEWEIVPYYARFTEMKERHTGLRRGFISMGESGINLLEWFFPIMGFGYIVSVKI
jgi:hypothetical protein